MSRWFVTLTVIAALIGFSGVAYAQQDGTGAARFEIVLDPLGGMFWTEGTEEGGGPDFNQYHTALSATYNVNSYWGIEGELAGDFGISQDLTLPTPGTLSLSDTTSPGAVGFAGNVVVYPWTADRQFVPFVTGGLGGLSMLDRIDRNGFTTDNHTFLTTNVGGGMKYYWGRWGVRGDYRFLSVNSSTEADPFFGQAGDRYGHRISGGIVLKFVR